MGFVFYSAKKTGANASFDQIFQFNAILTDAEFDELDRFEVRCRLLPSVVPSPGALRETSVTVKQLTDSSLPSHYQMVCAIKAKLEEWSPAIFIGYNSISVDEHFLRQAFFQTLHSPYLTNTNGNCRSDSLRFFQAIEFYQPGAFAVPINEEGKPSFKLDQLAPANGFDQSAVHGAMADVEAMIHMCWIIAERSEMYWSNFVRFAQKAAVSDFIIEEDIFLLTDFFHGKRYSWMVTAIGHNPDNGSEMLVFNLSVDPNELVGLDDEELARRLSEWPKPVRSVRTNACPCVLSYDDAPDHIRAGSPDLAELVVRAACIRGEPGFRGRLTAAFLNNRGSREPSSHVEEQIYDSFIGYGDQVLMDQFHQAEWASRPQIVTQFADPRLRRLGERLVYYEAPELIPTERRAALDAELARRLMDQEGTVPWRTYPKAIADTDDLLATARGNEADILTDLRGYLVGKSEMLGALVASYGASGGAGPGSREPNLAMGEFRPFGVDPSRV